MRPAIAIVTGLAFERETLQSAAHTAGGEARVAIRAAGPGRAAARRSAAGLIAGGAELVVSMGLAGGLDPARRTGEAVLAEGVRDGTRRLPVSREHRARLSAVLSGESGIVGGDIAHASAPVTTPAAKRALFAETGAAVADMESYAVAEAAEEAGAAFLALRVVADPAEQTIPPAALTGMRGDGRTAAWPVLCAALADPRQIPALTRLARQGRKARSVLHGLGGSLFLGLGRLAL